MAGDDTKEKRGSPRRRVLKGGIVAFQDHRLTVVCTVRNLSASGARLRVEGSVPAPDKFVLVIEADNFEVDCEVASRKGNDLGVKFVSPPRTLKTTAKAVKKDSGEW